MAILGEYAEDDLWPDFGTVVVTDTGSPGRGTEAMHGPTGLESIPFGTMASAGPGWLRIGASDGPFALRLELHDTAPPLDLDTWDTGVDLPYRSASGVVGVGGFADPPDRDQLTLAGSGEYRARVLRAYPPIPEDIDDEDDNEDEGRLLVQFWRADPEPPRWLRRNAPAVRRHWSWAPVLGQAAEDMLSSVRTMADGRRVAAPADVERHFGHPLDGPLPTETDGPDPAVAAARLGVPAPTTPRGLLEVLVAAGALVVAEGGFSLHESPAIPEALADFSFSTDGTDQNNFGLLVGDLVMISVHRPGPWTVAALAERTLTPAVDVRDALEWAARTECARVDGDLDGEFTVAKA